MGNPLLQLDRRVRALANSQPESPWRAVGRVHSKALEADVKWRLFDVPSHRVPNRGAARFVPLADEDEGQVEMLGPDESQMVAAQAAGADVLDSGNRTARGGRQFDGDEEPHAGR
jgi:hypothetical protein